MKIRITKKGLPKAQFGQVGQPLTMAPGFVPPNPMAWINNVQPNVQPYVQISTPDAKQFASADDEANRNFEMSQRPPMDYQMLHRTMWTAPQIPVPKPAGTDLQLIKQDGRYNVETPWEDVRDLANSPDKRTKSSIQKKSMWADVGLVTQGLTAGLNAVNDMISDRRKQRMLNQAITNSMLNPTPTPRTSGDRGDYTVNEGLFRPDDMQTPNKGMFAGLYYPQNNYMQFGGGIIPDEIIQPSGVDIPIEISPEASQANQQLVDSSTDGGYVFPLDEYSVTSDFGPRKAPTKGASTNHGGVDLGVPANTPVKAPMTGKVVKAWYDDQHGGGKSIVIEHPDGTKTGYAHLNKFNVTVGDVVNPGDVIALSGNTGRSTGPHLHLTVRNPDGVAIDPLRFFGMPRQRKASKKDTPIPSGGQISFTHNNPLNIHYGDFAKKYSGQKGGDDNGGNVAVFPDMNVGIQAAKDLLFGPNYSNLTISQARNKWVNGNPSMHSDSTPHIVKSMGGDKVLSQLSISERDKLLKEFAKWEGRQAYEVIKDRSLFEDGGPVEFLEGGVYSLTQDQLQRFLEAGGQVEFV